VKVSERSNVVSSFTVIKGAMIQETFEVLQRWDFAASKKENLDRLREQNYIAATSATWLRDVAKVLNRRLDPGGRDRSLAVLAQGGCLMEEWRPILLWHMTRDEFLVRDFLVNWLFREYEDGAFRVRTEDLHDYVCTIRSRGGDTEHEWTDTTVRRVAVGLLKIGADFGLLAGSGSKEFTSYHLPDRSLLYLLHAALEQANGNPGKALDTDDWHMYLMRRSDLERELLRLHQFQQIHYEAAGSLIQLSLPAPSALAYAEAMVA
jgi:hypothetical protein